MSKTGVASVVVVLAGVAAFSIWRFMPRDLKEPAAGPLSEAVGQSERTDESPVATSVVEPPAVGDPVAEHNRASAARQKEESVVKIARLGEVTIPLRFHVVPPLRHDLSHIDDGVSAGFFDPLAREAAAGDDTAADRLYMNLQGCEQMPTTTEELASYEEETRKEYAKTGGVFGGVASETTLDERLAWWRRKYERCRGVTEEMYPQALGFLRESAARGDTRNTLLYGMAIRKRSPEEARPYFEDLWRRGYVAGLDALGEYSLSHNIASIALEIAEADGREEEMLARVKRQRLDELAALERSTSPATYGEAMQQAATLLLRNANCCKL